MGRSEGNNGRADHEDRPDRISIPHPIREAETVALSAGECQECYRNLKDQAMVKASHPRDSAGRFTAADGPIKKGIFLRVTAADWKLLESERKRRGLPAITTLVMDQVMPLLEELREERGELRE